MTRSLTPRAYRWIWIAAALVVGALVTARVELLVLAFPLVAGLAGGLVLARKPEVSVEISVSQDRCLEGDSVVTEIGLWSEATVGHLELVLRAPLGFETEGHRYLAVAISPAARVERSVTLRPRRWGLHRLGMVALRGYGPGRFVRWEWKVDGEVPVKVFPRLERIRKGIVPPTTQVYSGNYVARSSGAGIEFAQVRGFEAGDRIRSVNWRVTTRRGELHVNVFHPERNADLVIFLDSFGDLGSVELGSLELAVRGASGVARHHLARKDRVGLVVFGGVVRWITAAMGRTQVYRITDALLSSRALFSYADKGIDLLPRGSFPPGATIVAFSPLVDRRSVDAFGDLHARGFPLIVVDTLPEELVEPGGSRAEAIAHRVWKMRREQMRADFASIGVPVLHWWEQDRLDAILSSVPPLPSARAVRAV